ncbi:MAG: hypothetical protein NTV86_14455 [Planctomycetota bacterium]|nr:hypothetical protein [Planctomycetota bacterium]
MVDTIAMSGSSKRAKNLAVIVAASLLSLATVAMILLRQQPSKKRETLPAPWPVGISVDPGTFRMTSLPTTFGPYRMLQMEDGLGTSEEAPIGEVIYAADVLYNLGIGSNKDKRNLPLRCSNWYVSRLYLDTRTFQRGRSALPLSVWHLDVTYFPGAMELGSRPPEAANHPGREILGCQTVRFPVSLSSRWRKWWGNSVTFTRVLSESRRGCERWVDYYMFVVDGMPETDRQDVRKKALDTQDRQFYYAKILLAPRDWNSDDVPPVDEAAAEFIRHALPPVLECLPSPDDVK